VTWMHPARALEVREDIHRRVAGEVRVRLEPAPPGTELAVYGAKQEAIGGQRLTPE
jgi:hypothetical protein